MVALAAGKVPPPSAPLFEQFSEYKDLVEADPRRKGLPIADALTMTLGLQWDEILIPYSDPKNDKIGMEMAKDRYRFILDRPVIGPPTKRWLYSGGATALVGRIIAKARANHCLITRVPRCSVPSLSDGPSGSTTKTPGLPHAMGRATVTVRCNW
jgi:hypothetical protein